MRTPIPIGPSFTTSRSSRHTFPLHALPQDIARYRDRYLDGWDVMRQRRYARQREMGLVNTTLSELEPEVGPPYHFSVALKIAGAR